MFAVAFLACLLSPVARGSLLAGVLGPAWCPTWGAFRQQAAVHACTSRSAAAGWVHVHAEALKGFVDDCCCAGRDLLTFGGEPAPLAVYAAATLHGFKQPFLPVSKL